MVNCEPLIDDGGNLIGFVAKGAHHIYVMEAAIRHYAETEHGPGEPLTQYEFDQRWHRIYTAHYRWIPCPPAWDVPYNRRLEESKEGRGAFLATVVWL
jgi:hypothetical protein